MMFIELVAFHRSKRINFIVIYQDSWNKIGDICHKYFLLRMVLHGIYSFVCLFVFLLKENENIFIHQLVVDMAATT